MSLTLTFSSTNNAPELYFTLDKEKYKGDNEKFKNIINILNKGPVCLGHSRFLEQKNLFHVWLIRTHWVGDDDNYSKIGNGDLQLQKELLQGWAITDYTDLYNKEEDKHYTKISLSNANRKTKTLDITSNDRHAPIIDGIYATLFLTRSFFKDYTINFAITDSGKQLMNTMPQLDPVESLDFGFEPTYAYLNRLNNIINDTEIDKKETIELTREIHLKSEVKTQTFSSKVDTYDAHKIFNKIQTQYVDDPEWKPLWKIKESTSKVDFMSFYTPLPKLIEECKRHVSLQTDSNQKISTSPKKTTLKRVKPAANKATPIGRKGFSSFIRSIFDTISSACRRFWNFLFGR
jgi:hypothetical protein